MRIKPLINRPYHARIPVSYFPNKNLFVDIKFLPKAFDDFKYLLVTTYEIRNLILIKPIKTRAAQVVHSCIDHKVRSILGLP